MSLLIKIDFPVVDYIDYKNLTLYVPIKKIPWLAKRASKKYPTFAEIYSEKENGIVARGRIEQPAIKVSSLPKEERQYIFDSSYFQLEVFLNDYAEKGALLNSRVLEKIPAVNQFEKVRPYNSKVPYFAYGLTNEINYLYKEKTHLFNFISSTNNKQFFSKLRLVRSNYINRHSYNMNALKRNIPFICSFCKVKGLPFDINKGSYFSLIEKQSVVTNNIFIKILNENVLQLCTKCYKKECLN